MSSGPFGTNWLDLSNSSNCLIKTYVKGLLDISGGNLYVRNGKLNVNSGDISLNGRLFSSGDASLNNRLFLGSDLSMGGNLYVGKKAFFSSDISINGNLYATFTTGSIPLNAINGTISSGSSSNFTTDVSMNKRLFVTSDISFGGNLISNYIGTSIQNINSTGIAGQTWSSISTSTGLSTVQPFTSTAMNSTGKYMIAGSGTGTVNGFVYLSNNYGSNWTSLSTSTGLPTSVPYSSVSISSTGLYQLATSGGTTYGQVYISNNYGISFINTVTVPNGLPTQNLNYIGSSMSSTGQYMVACSTDITYGYGLAISNNYGLLWQPLNSYVTSLSTSTGLPTNIAYNNVYVNSTGQYILASSTSTSYGLNFSNSYGLSWQTISSANNGSTYGLSTITAYQNVSISSSGQYMLAITTVSSTGAGTANGLVYMSSNYGNNWSLISNTNLVSTVTYNSISISSTGQYMLAGSSTSISESTNYGQSWSVLSTSTGLSTSLNYSSVSMTSTGNYMLACTGTNTTNGQLYLSVPPTVSKNVTTVNGQLWTTDLSINGQIYSNTLNTSNLLVNSSSQTVNIASSNSWSQCATILTTTSANIATASIGWIGLAISSTGQYQSSCVYNTAGYGIFTSNNYGITVTQCPTITTTTGTNIATTAIKWFNMSISSTGQYQFSIVNATASYGIFSSNNYGVSFAQCASIIGTNGTNIATTGIKWQSISTSATGQYVCAIVNTTATYGIFISNNYGASFTQCSAVITSNGTNIATTSIGWYSVQISATGQYISIAVNGTSGYGIFTSNNYGTSFAQCVSIITTTNTNLYTVSTTWYSMTVSSSGQYQSVLANAGYIFISNNYGSTFTQCPSIITTTGSNVATTTIGWCSMAMSSSGQYQLGLANQSASVAVVFSTNYGLSFNQYSSILTTTGLNIATKNTTWQCIAISSNGQYQTTAINTIAGNGLFTLQNPMTTSTIATTSPYTNLTGYVGFTDASGTPNTATTRALVEINGQGGGYSVAPSMFNNFNSTNSVNGIILGQNAPYSLYTSGSLLIGQEINIASDIRIKTNVLDIVDMSALDVLRQLKPKRYNYIDIAGRGTSPVWGYIAQDVASVLDYSVKTTTDFIPNIYQMVTIFGNKVTLLGPGHGNSHGTSNTGSSTVTILDAQNNTVSYDLSGNMIVTEKSNGNGTGTITVLDTFYAQTDSYGNITYIDESGQSATIDGSNNIIVTSPPVSSTASFLPNLISGDPIRLKFYDSNNNVWYSTITSIIDGENFMIADDLTGQNTLTTMFLYGQEVEDFHVLDKMAIYTIATASLQELDKEHQQTIQDVIDLSNNNGELLKQQSNLQAQLDAILQRLVSANVA